MKKRLLCFLVISLLLAGCGQNKQPGTSAEGDNGKAVYVKTSPVEAGDFARILSLPGNLQPVEQALITAKVSGTAQRVFVDIGTRVSKGQTLCKIEDTTFALQHKKAFSDLASEEVRYGDAERNYQRMQELYTSQAISQADFEKIESQFKMAKEDLSRARYNYELAGENLKETNITSPISGIVSLKDLSEGENIGPGKAIFAIVNTEQMYVETGISEQDIAAVKEGQPVTISVSSLKGSTFEGKVTHIGPVPDPSAKTYPVKITVGNKDNILKAGMFATVEILFDKRTASLSVPKEAVITEEGLKYVFVEREGKAEKRLIEIGYGNDARFEVLKGLSSDEKVVSVGYDSLTDGSSVEVR